MNISFGLFFMILCPRAISFFILRMKTLTPLLTCQIFWCLFFSEIGDEAVLKTLWERYEKAADKVLFFFILKFSISLSVSFSRFLKVT